jgi:hypothetical protein
MPQWDIVDYGCTVKRYFLDGRWADFRAIVVEAVIKAMTSAYDAVLDQLNLANGENPINELIAKSIVNITATGERAITR